MPADHNKAILNLVKLDWLSWVMLVDHREIQRVLGTVVLVMQLE